MFNAWLCLFQVQQSLQFSYDPQATTGADSTGNGFASISAVTAALVRADEAPPPSMTAAANSAITTATVNDEDSDSQASADTLVDELVSAAAAAAAATTTAAATANESTIHLEDIASEAARQHGIN